MTLRQYLILVGAGSLVGWGAWLLVLFTINPYDAGLMGFALFYSSLTIALVGTLALIGFGIRMWVFEHEGIVLRQVTTAFRQACFLALVFVGSLFLQSRDLLRWWNVLIFIGTLTILELFIVSSRYSRR
ncbi:MAG: hypothetical protein HY460_01920 [Parcubacteria group bacterium]|nr:hypothetical protein [Parcubacteria group bacterium]